MSSFSRRVRRLLPLLLSLTLLSCAILPIHAKPRATVDCQQIPLPRCTGAIGDVSAQAAVLIDADSGQILYGKNEAVRLPMASNTKIMTALCAVELADVGDTVTVPPEAVGIEGSSVYLYENEQLTLEQLLQALLLESANDAAVAIAVATAGSVESFAAYMNKKAAELGLQNTHFENPHGLDAEAHYTTAYDLAMITREALSHPTLARIFATRKITIPLNGTQGVRLLLNHNKMLRNYPGAIGVKTGFTKRSGRCLVSAAERDGLTLIAVTLHAPDDWDDHTRMLDAGFAAYERVTFCARDGFESMLPVTGGKEAYVLVQNAQEAAMTLPRDRGAMSCTVELERFLYAPVLKNAPVGALIFRCDTDKNGTAETLATVPLVCTYGIEQRTPLTLWQRIVRFFTGKQTN